MHRLLPLTLLAFLLGCGTFKTPTVEEQIIATIEAVTDGAQRADLGATLEPFSLRYQDEEGLGRDGIKGLLFREFHRNGAITSILGPIEVTMESTGEQATASFDAVLMTGVSLLDGSPLPDQVEAWHFEVVLEREAENWRITAHTREKGLDATQLLERVPPS